MKDYIYEVARIRVMENSLLTKADLDQLLAAPDHEAALAYLADKGWGGGAGVTDAETMLKAEEDATWALMTELLGEGRELDILRLTRDYHNLKAAIKDIYASSGLAPERLYLEGGTVPAEEIRQAVAEENFGRLPEAMQEAAVQAQQVLSRTGDGQLCDSIIDKAALDALTAAAEDAPDPVLAAYAATTVVNADIRIALRAAAAGKNAAEIAAQLAEAPDLNRSALAEAAVGGKSSVAEYLKGTPYSALADSLSRSMSAFECACDDLMIDRILPQKSEALSLGPLAAYVIARETEIKSVRLLLTGLQNGLPREQIRESLRQCYG
ncbi:MAG: V-type ATPase subunit [Lachnospiraceae bacterium]|nr:V-type ATPase subunit [Lachnospiraceae bacterium]